MKSSLLLAGAGCALIFAGFVLARTLTADRLPEIPAQVPLQGDALIARGYYLTHNVGMCVDCHSPRGPAGQFIEQRHLMGSELLFVPTVPMPWAPAAPGLAGLPAGYSPESMIHFLMTGERPGNIGPARPPMPEIRFNKEDAEAVTAYLASLATVEND